MFVFIVRRLLWAIPILIAASLLAFLLIDISGDPLSELREDPNIPQESIAAEEERLYLDQERHVRYQLWVTGSAVEFSSTGVGVVHGDGDIGLLRGEFGPSVRGEVYQIGEEIGERFLLTLRLIGVAMVFALGLAILSGVISAIRQYSKVDYVLTFIGFLALAMPTFWLAALLQRGGVWSNEELGTNLATYGDSTSPHIAQDFTPLENVADIAAHLFLPTVALMLTAYAQWSRYQRASMLEVLNSDYVRLARAKGLPNRVVMRRHALRTALIPLTSVVAVGIAGLIDGVVVIESIFQWRGLGTFFISAINERDAYALMGWLMLSGVIVIVANLIADLLYAVLDPRIRYE
ncbi:ABC transporter permease [Lipingzhangella sp. LS1_29]|uniref:ABC transporter permease n=1 Tax=Lipingzhangella rawalii TaxID=2055835 RepID=A0ABU2H4I1_9ACTN|nr:ABC transporter permease [Lipingzhangella rawalii]MDS1269769.1 ABC transporter permease [Lipingzhangella rawalii]